MIKENDSDTQNKRLPYWVLFLGLSGIINFVFCFWNLSPPNEGRTVYFWFTEFYGNFYLPSFLLLPVGIMAVACWFSRLPKREGAEKLFVIMGGIIAALVFIPAFGLTVFSAHLRIVGKVKQENRIYYLVKHYDDLAADYSFCTSDIIGFSDNCEYIGWSGDYADPVIYIDESTNYITVRSEKPSFIWINSNPPKCINESNEINGETYVGGCSD